MLGTLPVTRNSWKLRVWAAGGAGIPFPQENAASVTRVFQELAWGMYDAAGLMRTLELCSRSLAPHKLCDLVTANHLATWETCGQTPDMQLQCMTDLLFCEGFP